MLTFVHVRTGSLDRMCRFYRVDLRVRELRLGRRRRRDGLHTDDLLVGAESHDAIFLGIQPAQERGEGRQ